MKIFSSYKAVLLSAMLAGCSGMSMGSSSEAPAKTADGILTNSTGMTLYTSDRDSAGKSACNGPCATNWPPLMAKEGDKATGDYSIITRDDGKRQWAYKGKPLYTWTKDQKPGDKSGDGVNNVWHIAKP